MDVKISHYQPYQPYERTIYIYIERERERHRGVHIINLLGLLGCGEQPEPEVWHWALGQAFAQLGMKFVSLDIQRPKITWVWYSSNTITMAVELVY